MADTGWLNFSSFSSDGTVQSGVPWLFPQSAQLSDASATFVNDGVSTASEGLKGLNSGGVIPAGAAIDGYEVRVRWSTEDNSFDPTYFPAYQSLVRLVVNGAVAGSNKSSGAMLPLHSPAYTTFGGATDKWGLTPTAAQLNSATSGVVVAVDDGGTGQAVNAYIDHVQIKYYYTAAAAAPNTGIWCVM